MTGNGEDPKRDPLGTWEPRPLPEVTPETERFWAAAAEGRFLLSECRDCGLVYHYPRARCPDCLGGDVGWLEAAGTGTVYSYTVLPTRAGWPEAALPLVIVYVELDEGVRVISSLVGTEQGSGSDRGSDPETDREPDSDPDAHPDSGSDAGPRNESDPEGRAGAAPVAVGDRVAAAFVPTKREGVAIPVFRPVGDAD